jgi:hypothetical protein
VSDGGHSDRSIILVAHGGLYTAMLPAVLKNVDSAFARRHGLSYAGYVVAETRPDGLYCLSWCRVSVDG